MASPFAPLLIRVGRAELIQASIGAGYLLLGAAMVWIGLATRSDGLLLAAAAVVAAGAAWAWHLSNRRWHLIHDTPTALLRSAAQGYTEIAGIADLSPGQHPLSINGLPPCVWFEVVITDHGGARTSRWTRSSDETFVLRDSTGYCIIDPDDAEVHFSHTRSWRVGERRYRARFMRQGDPLYALGSLQTQRGADGGFDRRADIAHLLRQWKSNPVSLRRRFDHDQDGQISPEEWQDAVTEAETIVDSQHRDRREHPDVHVMRAPGHGVPYILSNRDPESLARRFRHWSWLHAGAFVAALVAGALLSAGRI